MGKQVVDNSASVKGDKNNFTYSALFWLFLFGSIAGFLEEWWSI